MCKSHDERVVQRGAEMTDTPNTEKSLTTEKVKEISLPAAVLAIAAASRGARNTSDMPGRLVFAGAVLILRE